MNPTRGLRRILARLFGVTPEGTDEGTTHSRLLRGSIGGLGLNITTTALYFLIGILLARLLGASAYGAYSYAISWSMVLGVVGGFGLNRLLVRNIASYHTHAKWGLLNGQLSWATKVALTASIGAAAAAYAISWLLRDHFHEGMLIPFWIGLLLLPITSLMHANQASLQGLHRVILGQTAGSVVQPVALLLLVSVAAALVSEAFNASYAVALHVLSVALGWIVSSSLLRCHLPVPVRSAPPEWQRRVWLRSALSMLLLGGLHIINSRTDIIMLGSMLGAAATGVYSVAVRGSELVMFVMAPVHTALAPTASALHARGERQQLQRVITKSSHAIFLLSIPIVIVLSAFGYWFLILFGSEFLPGQSALTILCVGKLISLGLGPVALLLIMTGYEREAALGAGLSALLNIVLNAIMIPIWGLEGAATATAISTVCLAALMGVWVRNRLGIRADVLKLN